MKWSEFAALISGLNSETPLGVIVSIRAEQDKEILKHFSKAQHRIRNSYRNCKAKSISAANTDAFIEAIKQAFVGMAK